MSQTHDIFPNHRFLLFGNSDVREAEKGLFPVGLGGKSKESSYYLDI